jgi:hypothetical protein
MLLESHLDFNRNEAQNVVIHNVAALNTAPKNGMLQYLTVNGQQGLYLRREGFWVNLGQVEALVNGGIQVTTVTGIQFLQVRVDNDTIKINGAGNLEVGPNSIGNDELDNANIRIGDFAAPNANFSMANFKITGLGNPSVNSDAVNKEYVDLEIASKIAAMGDFVGDWSGPGLPTIGSGTSGAIRKGDFWRITTAFTIGVHVMEVGDALFSRQNAPGAIDANFFVLQSNAGEASATALGMVRVSVSGDLTTDAGANTTRVVRIADLLLRTATATRVGMISLATQAEVLAGTNSLKAVTPATLAIYVNTALSSTGFAANIGDGVATNIVLTHNFGTRDVIPDIYRSVSPFDKIIVDVSKTSINSCTVSFTVAPTIGQYRFCALKIA